MKGLIKTKSGKSKKHTVPLTGTTGDLLKLIRALSRRYLRALTSRRACWQDACNPTHKKRSDKERFFISDASISQTTNNPAPPTPPLPAPAA